MELSTHLDRQLSELVRANCKEVFELEVIQKNALCHQIRRYGSTIEMDVSR